MSNTEPNRRPTSDADLIALRDLCLEIFKDRQNNPAYHKDRVYLNITELVALATVSLTNAVQNQANAGKILALYKDSDASISI